MVYTFSLRPHSLFCKILLTVCLISFTTLCFSRNVDTLFSPPQNSEDSYSSSDSEDESDSKADSTPQPEIPLKVAASENLPSSASEPLDGGASSDDAGKFCAASPLRVAASENLPSSASEPLDGGTSSDDAGKFCAASPLSSTFGGEVWQLTVTAGSTQYTKHIVTDIGINQESQLDKPDNLFLFEEIREFNEKNARDSDNDSDSDSDSDIDIDSDKAKISMLEKKPRVNSDAVKTLNTLVKAGEHLLKNTEPLSSTALTKESLHLLVVYDSPPSFEYKGAEKESLPLVVYGSPSPFEDKGAEGERKGLFYLPADFTLDQCEASADKENKTVTFTNEQNLFFEACITYKDHTESILRPVHIQLKTNKTLTNYWGAICGRDPSTQLTLNFFWPEHNPITHKAQTINDTDLQATSPTSSEPVLSQIWKFSIYRVTPPPGAIQIEEYGGKLVAHTLDMKASSEEKSTFFTARNKKKHSDKSRIGIGFKLLAGGPSSNSKKTLDRVNYVELDTAVAKFCNTIIDAGLTTLLDKPLITNHEIGIKFEYGKTWLFGSSETWFDKSKGTFEIPVGVNLNSFIPSKNSDENTTTITFTHSAYECKVVFEKSNTSPLHIRAAVHINPYDPGELLIIDCLHDWYQTPLVNAGALLDYAKERVQLRRAAIIAGTP